MTEQKSESIIQQTNQQNHNSTATFPSKCETKKKLTLNHTKLGPFTEDK